MEKLPTDIINLIVEYSVNKCELCETEINIIYTHYNRRRNIYQSICKKCAKEFMWYEMKMEYTITEEEMREDFYIKKISSKKQIYKILYDI